MAAAAVLAAAAEVAADQRDATVAAVQIGAPEVHPTINFSRPKDAAAEAVAVADLMDHPGSLWKRARTRRPMRERKGTSHRWMKWTHEGKIGKMTG